MKAWNLKGIFASFLTYVVWILLSPWIGSLIRLLPLPEPYAAYLSTIGGSLAMAAGVALSAWLLMGKSLLECISPRPNPVRFWVPFASAVVSFTVLSLIRIAIHPTLFVWQSPRLSTYLGMLVLVLVMNLIQSGSEEFMMRIFPGRVLPGRLASSLLCTLLFLLPHLGNLELKEGNRPLVLLSYAVFGFWGTWESLTEGGFGYSLALHAANNLVVSLLVGYQSTELKTYPLFMSLERSGSPSELLVLIVTLAVSSLFSRLALAYTQSHGKETTNLPEETQ